MKKNNIIEKLFNLILLISIVYMIHDIKKIVYLTIISIIILIILKMINTFIDKKTPIIVTKNNILIVGILLLGYSFISIIFNYSYIIGYDKNTFIFIINYLSSIISIITIFQLCKRKNNIKVSNLSLVLSIPIYIFMLYYNGNDILLSIIALNILILYFIEGFDKNSPNRKKNIVRILVIGIFSIITGILFPFGLLILIPIVFTITKKNIVKKTIIYDLFFILISLISLYINKFMNIEIIFNSNLECIIILIIIYFILNLITLQNNEKYYIYKNTIIFTVTYILLIQYFQNIDYLIILIPVLIVSISISINSKIQINLDIKKYKKILPENAKKVSVVIPNYNYANYIESRIDSILDQNYPIYELIILDDCSKDNSEEIILNKIEKIKENRSEINIKYIPNEINSGNVFKQWQKCFEVSTGDYLWICEADDLCSKYFLNAVMRGFSNEKVVISYSESKAINENGKVFKKDLRDWIDLFNIGKWNKSYINSGLNELKQTMCINNTIANVSGVVFKKDNTIPFIKYLKKSQSFTLAGDWYFYSKVLLHGDIFYHAESLNYHRIHTNSVTTTTDNFIHYKEIEYIQNSIMDDVKLDHSTKELIKIRRNQIIRNLCISKDELKYDKISLKKLIKNNNIKDEILLSIIIPVYNVEKYIDKCLKSVFKDIPIKTEVIIINDGSPDNCEKIIKEYEKKYSEIKYIKKENGGLSSVKNVGLKEAKGRYIIFLDSDDYVSSNMYNTLLKKAIDTNSDIVYSDVLMTYEDGTVRYCSMTNYEEKDKILKILNVPLMAASWNKIVKRELYDNLTFPEGYNNEDVAVSPLLILRSKKTTNIVTPFYKYVQRSGSIQNSGFNEKRFVIFETAKMCFDKIRDYNIETQKKVQGSILTHQILALLLYPIKEIKDKDEQYRLIEIFIKKYKNLNVIRENKIIDMYLKKCNKPNLIKYIEEENIKKIIKYINKE